jgi:hypothetical protein
MKRIGKTLNRAIYGAEGSEEMMVDIRIADCHGKGTFRPKLSSLCFKGTGRIGVIFFQIYATQNVIYNKLFLVECNKLLLFKKRYTTFKRLANKTYSI